MLKKNFFEIYNFVFSNLNILIISFCHLVFSCLTDRFIFAPELRHSLRYVLLKILLFTILFIFWFYILKFFKMLKHKNISCILYFKCFITYWIIMSIFMFCLWPGNWRWDEQSILTGAIYGLRILAWHNILTSIWYIISLMLIPSPVGIVIIEYTIISVIVGYIVGKSCYLVGKKGVIIGIVFLMPSVIAHNLYPMRLCLYAYVLLLYFFVLLTNINKISNMSHHQLFLMIILSALVSAWRTEGMILILCFPVLIILNKRNLKSYCISLISIVCSILMIFVQTYVQNLGEGDLDNKQYFITALVLPLNELVKEEYKSNPNGERIAELNGLVDLDTILKSSNGTEAFWKDAYANIKTDEQYDRLNSIYIKMALRNPMIFIKERLSCFLSSNNIMICYNDRNIVFSEGVLDEYIATNFINYDLRENIMDIITGTTGNKYFDKFVLLSYFPAVPIIILVVICIVNAFFKKKHIKETILFVLLVVQAIAVILTAPGALFMYYFPYFLCGYFSMIYYILKLSNNVILHEKFISKKGC